MTARNLPSHVRLTRRQTDRHRASIRTGELIARLQRYVLDQLGQGESEMTSTQVRAAQVLLDKSLPNLQYIDQHMSSDEHEGASEAQLMSKLTQWLVGNPQLLAALASRGVTIEGSSITARIGQDSAESETVADQPLGDSEAAQGSEEPEQG